MVGNPKMCAECGYLHEKHATSCKRGIAEARMKTSIAIVDQLVAAFPMGERLNARSKLLHLMTECVLAFDTPEVRRIYSDLMYERGYHRPWEGS